MNLNNSSRKETGVLGERMTAEYLRKYGFTIIGRNVARKTGEIDIIAKKKDVYHFVEVKSLLCEEFPAPEGPTGRTASRTEKAAVRVQHDEYSPAENLHAYKLRKVARTAEWYLAEVAWEGEWQVDGALVWLRRRDGMAHVRYLPRIL
jgi:hypothetical protein